MRLDGLTAEIDALAGLDPAALADAESIVALYRQMERLRAVTARAVARFDTNGGWQQDRARTTAAWVAAKCRQPQPFAKRDVALARALRDLPASERAWLAGDISTAHVGVLAGLRRVATAAQLASDEESLVGKAKTLPLFHHFTKMVAYWEQHADPDGTEDHAVSQRDQRRFHLSQSFQGMWFGDLTLDPISGQIVTNQLQAIVDELFAEDWADTKARLGRVPDVTELARTPRQRRADALVEMAVRAGTAPSHGLRPQPLVTVMVGWESFHGRMCELDNGTVIAPVALVPWLKEAWIERVVFGSPSRVLDVGRSQRLFKGATRRAVEVRDRECCHPTCDIPACGCQVDHIIPYGEGGPTIQDNGQMACPFHNRNRTSSRPPP